MSPVNDASVRGVPCQAIPRLLAIMNMHYSGLLDEFWVGCNVMRPGPVALAGQGFGFRQVGWARWP